MSLVGSLVLCLFLAVAIDAFVIHSSAPTGALRRLELKISANTGAARLSASTAPLPLTRSSFVTSASCKSAGGIAHGGKGAALSMKIINVGVIGAGRCVDVPVSASYDFRLAPLF